MGDLSLCGLTKAFGEHAAVRDLTLSIADGEFLALLGPSGCGKTTTLRLIAGFLEPDDGRIDVGGQTLSAKSAVVLPEQRDMSMVFQSYALWPHMTVAENVAFGLRYRRVHGDAARQQTVQALEMVKLESIASRYPAELSGGQQQRVALARALVVQPRTLLLDEPLSNLDASLREEMRAEIRRLHELVGVTTVYVTHDQVEALALADRVGLMNAGRLEQVGTPEEVYERPASPFVASFIGGSNLLTGVVTQDGRVALDSGSNQPLTVHPAHQMLAPGAAVHVSVRPHTISVRAAAETGRGANQLCGQIVAHSYVGERREYRVALETSESVLRVHAAPRARFQVGEKVMLDVQPEDCYVIAAT